MAVNDNFVNKNPLIGLAPNGQGSNIGATGEVGEPVQGGITNSVWWSWTAPNDGTFTIDTKNSNFDTFLSVFTGSAVNNLTLKAFNDDEIPGTYPFTSLLTLNATAGTTYQIAVDGYEGETGNIQLNIVPLVINGTLGPDTLTTTAYPETINGLAGNDNINGGDGNDTISGGDGNDILDGGFGADRFTGGLGSDTYIVDNVGDVIVNEIPSEESNTVRSSVTYTLPAGVRLFLLTGTAAINGTGNNLNNRIQGNSSDNTLWGMAGADLIGGDNGNDILYGGEDNDDLNGGVGADQLIGQWGNDIYTVDNAGDVVTELAGEGIDEVKATISYLLPAHVENLRFDGPPGPIMEAYLNGPAAFNGTGNNLPNVITGNNANNILDGGIGVDTLAGMLGNDTYVVDNVGDVVTELPNQGIDEVYSTVTYTLPANVENLYLEQSSTESLNGTGNDLPNLIRGGQFANVLNGGSGADSLYGGQGDDTYEVDNPGDIVGELPYYGRDLVNSSITYTLPADVENLTLTGTAAINGTGNNLGNTIVGNSANNTLTGGGGFNILTGNGGADTFLFKFVDSSLFVARDTISDFVIGTDKIDLLTQGGAAMNAPSSFSRATNDTTSNYLEDVANKVFIDANGELVGNQPLGINSAALVVVTSGSTASSYLIINDGTAGFQMSNDLVIGLVTSNPLPPVGNIPVTNFFV